MRAWSVELAVLMTQLKPIIAVLLPLFVATYLFKKLPRDSNRATVSGPFKGLTVNFQGGIAVYFFLALVLLFAPNPTPPPPSAPPGAEVWTVEGTIDWNPPGTSGPIEIRLLPPEQGVANNEFTVTFAKMPRNAGLLRFPTLSFEGRQAFHSRGQDQDVVHVWKAEEVLNLEQRVQANTVDIDVPHRFIRVRTPVVVTRTVIGETPFAPNGPAAQPLPN